MNRAVPAGEKLQLNTQPTSSSLASPAGEALALRNPDSGSQQQGKLRGTGRTKASTDTQITVALIDEHEFTRGCIATCLKILCADITVATFPTVAAYVASGPHAIDLVFYHAHGASKMEDMGTLLPALKRQLGPAPVVVVAAGDDVDTMRAALTAGARGYIPTSSTSLQVTIEVMRLVRAGGTFAPVNISLMQKASSRAEAGAAKGVPAHQFTPRQMAVLEHLKQGNANKVIAHELTMGEGTVKVHVRNIMKKLKATNRTQAVFRAYNLPAEKDPEAGGAGMTEPWPKTTA